jgi:hypothetical protein
MLAAACNLVAILASPFWAVKVRISDSDQGAIHSTTDHGQGS